jgi:hypothetical protein
MCAFLGAGAGDFALTISAATSSDGVAFVFEASPPSAPPPRLRLLPRELPPTLPASLAQVSCANNAAALGCTLPRFPVPARPPRPPLCCWQHQRAGAVITSAAGCAG